MSKVILGIDGGGTKTHAVLVDLSGKILATAANGGANWERTGIAAAQASLQEIVSRVLVSAGLQSKDIGAATFALAGIDWESDKELFAPVSQALDLPSDTSFINDSIAALFAGNPTGIGCVSIAGTGGKTSGRSSTKTLQTMGMDLGEGGGAGQLVSLALDYVARIYHGIESASSLTHLVLTECGYLDETSFFKAVARDGLRLTEDLAPKIFDLASAGDSGAITIVNQVAEQHATDVIGMINQLGLSGSSVLVIRAGGLHTAGCKTFDEAFEKTVNLAHPGAKTQVLDISPVYGAVVNAAHEYFGETSEEFLSNLFHQARTKGEL
jgi:N-acetylglucosamine kinase-like BadF-type ATPase